ncbi:uncharacterized protein MELLADRAFT_72772 [Melampsora larici-populina 98AG31]|uniref:Uncharacterized protein n=1 Tax=Melampsora larici-populina (strain 98AG31 / pathotype 3-4-7) TaxID=747676 RepID=F4RYN9_MELLP|nr:uncharacterized protein MELLADRAFT_72772 [Melampsora larici-populina 98AG31]EGG02545.1 hypothetical protein MELLADRAFT_72772 [Melampsora larici-populina 98AG31]
MHSETSEEDHEDHEDHEEDEEREEGERDRLVRPNGKPDGLKVRTDLQTNQFNSSNRTIKSSDRREDSNSIQRNHENLRSKSASGVYHQS